MDIKEAKKIMGKNFIGPEELKRIRSKLSIKDPYKIGRPMPDIPFSPLLLKEINKNNILILGIPAAKDGEKLTINKMRAIFGWEPRKKEPCFYNQDWYLKEKFAAETSLKLKWQLIKKRVDEKTRGKNPETLKNALFPSAILTAFTFFTYYFLSGEILWKHDFIWCSDKDKNGDRIYTGRYTDPKKVNKNGFNIHRHLSIRSCFGLAPQIL